MPPSHFQPKHSRETRVLRIWNIFVHKSLQLCLLPLGGFLEEELMGQGILTFQRLDTGCQIVYPKGGVVLFNQRNRI